MDPRRRALILYFPVIAAVIILAGFFTSTGYYRDLKRSAYERYLEKQYREISGMIHTGRSESIRSDHPELAAYQDFLMTMDPAERIIPKDRLYEAVKILKQRVLQKSGVESTLQWTQQPSDMGGRTRALLFDPADTAGKRLLAGSVTGGLWVLEDITDPLGRWMPLSDNLANMSISCLVADTMHSGTIYAGTGEPQTAVKMYRESSGLGNGIMKSVDSGNTWELLPATADFRYVSDMVVRTEGDTAVLYAAVVSGSYQGVFHSSHPSDGLYRSADGGQHWDQVLPKIPGSKDIFAPSDIEISPSGRIFVGTMRNLMGLGGGHILYSDNGYDWQIYDSMYQEITNLQDSTRNIPGRVILASAPSDSSRVYAVVAGGGRTEAGFIFYKAHAILRSDDSGNTWTKTAMPIEDGTWATLAWHALTLAVDPNNPDFLYAGGLDQHKSTDGGQTWHKISDWIGMYGGGGFAYIHADQHKVLFRKGSSDEIVFATDGGIFYTQNGSADYPGFIERNDRYSTLQFYTCAVHPQAGTSYFLAGAQDNGTLYYKGLPVNAGDMISGGDGAYCFFDREQPDYMITSVYYNRYYVYRSLSGLSTNLVQFIDSYYSGVFINPADYDNRTNTLYANAVTYEGNYPDQILRIDNVLSGPVGTFLEMNTGTPVYFSALTVSPYSSDGHTTLFAGTQSGELFRADMADLQPVTNMIGSNDFPAANISCIAVGTDEDHLLVIFSNYGVPSVWVTTDGGAEWRNAAGDLPDMPVRWGMFHPSNPAGAIIATELGVWMSSDLHTDPVSWVPANEGMASVRTDMIRYRPSDGLLLAATHGRGLYTTGSLVSEVRKQNEHEYGLTVYPNPATDYIHISGMYREHIRFEMISVSGDVVISRVFSPATTQADLKIDVSGIPSGTYFIRLTGEKGTGTSKVIIRK